MGHLFPLLGESLHATRVSRRLTEYGAHKRCLTYQAVGNECPPSVATNQSRAVRLHGRTLDHHMEQPAVRSRTSPSSTFGCLRYAESPNIWHAVRRLTKRVRLLYLVNTCVARVAWALSFFTLSTSIPGVCKWRKRKRKGKGKKDRWRMDKRAGA